MTDSVRVRQGVVISNKMQKTVVVEVVRHVRHSKYQKSIKRRIRYKAHDAGGICGEGDLVLLEETRPMSKTKKWVVRSILQKRAES